MFEVVILNSIPDLTQKEFDTMLRLVQLEKQKRIKRFHFFKDAQNCLLGEILVRVLICCATGLKNKQIEFSTNAYGKPFLAAISHLHFNISHAGRYVACAVDDVSVGVDIEQIKPIEQKIAERFFTLDETMYIMADFLPRFYEIWTKKESQIKWEGKGLYKALTSFSVFEAGKQERYHKVFQNEEVICHVCSTKKEPPIVRMLNTTGLIQKGVPLLM